MIHGSGSIVYRIFLRGSRTVRDSPLHKVVLVVITVVVVVEVVAVLVVVVVIVIAVVVVVVSSGGNSGGSGICGGIGRVVKSVQVLLDRFSSYGGSSSNAPRLGNCLR